MNLIGFVSSVFEILFIGGKDEEKAIEQPNVRDDASPIKKVKSSIPIEIKKATCETYISISSSIFNRQEIQAIYVKGRCIIAKNAKYGKIYVSPKIQNREHVYNKIAKKSNTHSSYQIYFYDDIVLCLLGDIFYEMSDIRFQYWDVYNDERATKKSFIKIEHKRK